MKEKGWNDHFVLAREGGDSEGSLTLHGFQTCPLPIISQAGGHRGKGWGEEELELTWEQEQHKEPEEAWRGTPAPQQEMEIQISVHKGTFMSVRVTRNRPAP